MEDKSKIELRAGAAAVGPPSFPETEVLLMNGKEGRRSMREGERKGDLIRCRSRLRKSVKTAITKTEGPDSETEREGVEGKNSPINLSKDLDTEGRQEVAMRNSK